MGWNVEISLVSVYLFRWTCSCMNLGDSVLQPTKLFVVHLLQFPLKIGKTLLLLQNLVKIRPAISTKDHAITARSQLLNVLIYY